MAMKEIKSSDEWEDICEQSKNGAVFVLKHSSTCPVSAAGFRAFDEYDTKLPKYYVTVQTHRNISNDIELSTGVAHETPQLLLLVDGKAVWNASHYVIMQSKIRSAEETYA